MNKNETSSYININKTKKYFFIIKKSCVGKYTNNKKSTIIVVFLIITSIIIFFFIKGANNLNILNNNNIIKYKYINVAYAFDNNYYYITHVSMKSLMLNQNKDTFIIFHILVAAAIYDEQKEVIDRICIEHNNCKIKYYKFTNEYKEFNVNTSRIKRTTAIFYRLSLQNLLKNETKTLYFDCDTIIYKDLNTMYNYNNTGKYYIGQYEGNPIKQYGNNLGKFINSGAILINLELLRKDKIHKKMIQFLRKFNNHLYYLDQDAINVVCNKKIGFFPDKYISAGLCNMKKIRKKNEEIQMNINKGNITDDEPYIFHFKNYFYKPWNGITNDNQNVCFEQIGRFYEYARKTIYYYKILEVFKVKFKDNILKSINIK